MSGLAATHAPPSRWRSPLAVAWICLVIFLHTALTFYFQRPSIFFADTALVGADFDTHYGQTARFVEAMRHWGQIWSYDPSLLAGHPAGVLFDCDTKAWNLWTFLLHGIGMSTARAFNSFVVVACLSIPWVALLTARLFRLDWAQTALFMGLSTLLWFFDSQTHYFWWIGMITWALGSFLALLPLGAFFRFVERARLGWGVCTACGLAVVLLVHPFTFFALVVPMGVWFARASRRARAGACAIAAFALAANAFWWWPALRFSRYALASPFYSQAGISDLLHDFLALAMNANDTAEFMRTGLRFLILGAGAFGLARWRTDRDPRFWPLLAAVVAMLATSYLGRYTWLTAQVQPYRFIVPATAWMALPAVAFATDRRTHAMVRRALPVVLVLSTSALQLVAHDILYFFPELIPPQVGFEVDAPLSPTGYPKHGERRHPRPSPLEQATVRWFRAHPTEGRVLVEPPVLGERLAAHVPNIQVMGGIRERNLVHARSNFFRLFPTRDASFDEFSAYLARYAVHYVVLSPVLPFPSQYAALLRPVASLIDARIFAVKQPSGLIASGPGAVRASMNRLAVTRSDPARPVVLRYHWLHTLACRPDCHIGPARPGDPLSFILVDAPHPADFVVYQAY